MSDTELPEVSIVVPLYNEEDNVRPLCEAIDDALADWPRTYEIVLVDDGSTDGTLRRLRDEAASNPRVSPVPLGVNSGQTRAMAEGFARSRGRIVVSMDGDLQNDPRDIPLMVDRLEDGFDVVCGWRRDRKDPWLSRTLPSRVANAMIAKVTGIPIHDNGCSLKAYRAEVVKALKLYSEMHRFLPALSSMTGARIAEVVVRHHPRRHGESKYGISRTFKVLSDMIAIKMLTQFANRPGQWFALLSLPWLALGGLSLAAWVGGLMGLGSRGAVVYSSLCFLFLYLTGHMLALSVLSEMILAQADRKHLRRLVAALVVTEVRNGSRGEHA